MAVVRLRHFLLKETVVIGSRSLYTTPGCNRVFNPLYIAPIVDSKRLAKMIETGEAKKLEHVPILPATNTDNVSVYNDPVFKKFTNYLMRKGDKVLAQTLMLKAFHRIKELQLYKYHREEDPVEKAKIEIDPMNIFHRAVENCKPLLELTPIKRGGSTYHVPIPVIDKRATLFAMNWLIEAGCQKDRKVIWSYKMALEFIAAADNKGSVVKRKQDLHKQCEANRAYAHYRWG